MRPNMKAQTSSWHGSHEAVLAFGECASSTPDEKGVRAKGEKEEGEEHDGAKSDSARRKNDERGHTTLPKRNPTIVHKNEKKIITRVCRKITTDNQKNAALTR